MNFIDNYNDFKEKQLTNRFFRHQDILQLLKQLPDDFQVGSLGKSAEGRSINAVRWGHGNTKIMFWSQMHGDEATGTMALFDLFNFLQSEHPVITQIKDYCHLLFIPMVNPDGAEKHTRRNSQQIDINRDYIETTSPEAIILKRCRDDFKPEFGFNLHDQDTLWSVAGNNLPATLSFLAPAFNPALHINPTRKKSMQVIASIYSQIKQLLPNQIGLFDDGFEPRAFGDNFQKSGTSTILIEAGAWNQDYEKQEIRKFYFSALIHGIISIVQEKYVSETEENYLNIPKNNKQIFHLLINNLKINNFRTSIGLNYEEDYDSATNSLSRVFKIVDMGDLSTFNAYQYFDGGNLQWRGEIKIDKPANFELIESNEIILAFKNGILLQKH